MTPQKQLNRHDPENGVLGDCYRTVIACLLDLKPEEVPHVHEHVGALNMQDQQDMMNAWLAARGLVEVVVPCAGDLELQTVLEIMARWSMGTHYMLTGYSRTGCNHVVICKGAEIIWDPSLNDSGIIAPADDGYYWFGFLGNLI